MKIKVETEKKYYCVKPERLLKLAMDLGFLEIKRVKEIEDGECKALIEAIMAKPLEEIKEMYNNREIEK